MASDSLNVIALISGGKDSFYSLLHCMQNGHRIVALANLHPPAQVAPEAVAEDEKDLNSFMYQTVGHEVIPLYAEATGVPLYRQSIDGGAVRHERDYAYDASEPGVDETESMFPLLQRIMKEHPEANALCSGAILSTYQRTRVESIAVRLGLTPLAYLWKYPVLPSPVKPANESQLLVDMEAAGMEARIIKVASAGLDESFLWECVSSEVGSNRVKQALRKFGPADGAALGEGGEFETLVVDGPACLFKKRIAVPEEGRVVVREGGGSTWLATRGAQLHDKDVPTRSKISNARIPNIFDPRFSEVFDELTSQPDAAATTSNVGSEARPLSKTELENTAKPELLSFNFLSDKPFENESIKEETSYIVEKLREALVAHELEPAQLTTVVIILRNMADFPQVNQVYGSLFQSPNPASRVTISCGDLLPAGRNIMIYATAPPASPALKRDGLHVQSRSYWAPANIGPYSQAIDIPLTQNGSPIGPHSVYIAGQIPLIPHTMVLPEPSGTSLAQQIALSLQHLWRVGVQMKVQQWSSVVAYFDKALSEEDMQLKARMAGKAWNLMHMQQEDEDEDASVDPWDLKYNTQYMSLASGDESKPKPLPDLETFPMRQQNEPDTCIPPFFAIEVAELPRQSTVEWHAHIGLSELPEASTTLISHSESQLGGWKSWSTIVRSGEGVFVHTVLASIASSSVANDVESQLTDAQTKYTDTLRLLGVKSGDATKQTPYLVYLDGKSLGSWAGESLPCALVPCRSIWTAESKRASCVALFRASMKS